MTRKEIENLFKTHYAQMYRLAATILYDDDESKDVVSEVFCTATQAIGRAESRHCRTVSAYGSTQPLATCGRTYHEIFQIKHITHV